MATRNSFVYRVDDIELDTGRRCIRRGATELPLGKRTYDLLALLAEAAPDVVTYEQMAVRLCGGRFVTRNTLKQRVKLLRDGLGDNAEEPRYIGIVRGHGYRMLCEVDRVTAAARAAGRWPAFAKAFWRQVSPPVSTG